MGRKYYGRFKLQPGHLNFKHSYKEVHGKITTFDEALSLVEHRQREKNARAERDKDVEKPRGPTRQQLFAIAKAQTAPKSKSIRKVKMPEFSIQKIE